MQNNTLNLISERESGEMKGEERNGVADLFHARSGWMMSHGSFIFHRMSGGIFRNKILVVSREEAA